jgi:4-amino-4-deoxy-L-arabinose transferase-like glycosyltransferase
MPAKRIRLLFFLAACAAYFYGLGNFPFVGPDEPRYAQVAREMFERGDMVTPTLGGHTWFEKPALPYWTMMAAYRLFGAGEWQARSGFALMGLLTVLLIYWMGARMEEEAVGEDKERARYLSLSCGVVAASSAGLILFSHGVNFDVPLTLTVTFALACFFISELKEKESGRKLLLAGFYAGTGAALLAKGLIGFILTFGIVSTYYILRRAWPARDVWLSLLWGVPLAILVAATWYAPVINRNGWTFIDEFIIQHHFARYTSNKYHHPQPFYFYLPVMLLFALPWTPYLLETLWNARSWRWRAPDALSKWRAFALAWLVMPVLFFSASGSKLPGYVLPALPGAIMLVSESVARLVRGEGNIRTLRLTGAMLALLGLAAVVYIETRDYAMKTGAVIAVLPFILCGLLAVVFAKRRVWATAAIVAAMFLMIVLGLSYGIGGVSRRLSMAYALEQARARGYGSSPVYQLHTIDRTAQYYAAGRLQYGADGEPLKFEGETQVEAAARAEGGTILVIVPSEFSRQLTTYKPLETEIIEDNNGRALLAVRIRK